VTLNPALGVNCALLVDRLAGLRSAEHLSAEPGDSPAPPQRPAFAGARWRDGDGRAWQEIELSALAAHEQFLKVAG
jgi:twitching motility protein PilI